MKRFSEKGMASLREPKTEDMKSKVRKPITLENGEGVTIFFESTHEASLFLGVSNGMISMIRTGRRPSANGWCVYYGEKINA